MKRVVVQLVVLGAVFALLPGFVLIPIMTSRRIAENEHAVTGSLKTIATQQEIFHCCEVDQDSDGGKSKGEYGFLAELCGEVAPRRGNATAPTRPRYISAAFHTGASGGRGFAEKDGYYFQVWLPGPDGPMTDTACGGTATTPGTRLDPKTHGNIIDLQEKHFVVYAWPVKHGETGRRTFAISEAGTCRATKGVYGGTELMPKPNAAFQKGQPVFAGELGNGEGNDGSVWEGVP